MEKICTMLSGGRIIRLLIVLVMCILLWKVWDYVSIDDQKSTSVMQPIPEQDSFNEIKKEDLDSLGDLKEDGSRPDAVKVGVYYEPLCPDSKNFVRLQLAPTMAKIGDKIDLSLVPYGKATTSGSGSSFSFQCQHGPTECLGNKVHACVVKYVPDTSVQIKIVSCMINENRKPTKIARKCVPRYAGDDAFPAIYKCFTTSEGDVLLNEMGKLTGKIAPRLSFVPTVTIDGSDDDLFNVLGNFMSAVCKKIKGPLPASCM